MLRSISVISLILLISIQLFSQSCDDMKGVWVNELGSALIIEEISHEGDIIGVYKSSTGVDGKTFNLKGYVNSHSEFPAEKNISFSVRWNGYGSITSWSGYCQVVDGKPQIKTIWNLVRSGKEFDWERIITNSSIFIAND